MTDHIYDNTLHREIANLERLFTTSLTASNDLTAQRFTGIEAQLDDIKTTFREYSHLTIANKDDLLNLKTTRRVAIELKRSIYAMGTLVVTALGVVATRL